nr:MAG TPA: hypothetical protein [Bacteriophage sp.]DAK57776.1 MAG TPA: hypothetical protein [Caudoviricetes sp.]DAQ77381.1 MAG TPA: hypothetical protein [Caudoviricetes sp.]DAT44017.1 MAG TPA: hypothetical protein [Caudoviricetes sp.]DAZ01547.1 MAG TPA: hypothetical protein [Caudoviricetes sp.]
MQNDCAVIVLIYPSKRANMCTTKGNTQLQKRRTL